MDWPVTAWLISDHDSKFMSAFWAALAKALNMKMLTSTAYHPQTDGQSERSNQSVEIALRFFITAHAHKDCTFTLPELQFKMNNSFNSTTGFTPTMLMYRQKGNLEAFLGLQTLPLDDSVALCALARAEAFDAVAMANVAIKLRYDGKHKPLRFQPGDHAYLRLGKGYSQVGYQSRKFAAQREGPGPFRVIRKVGDLAYKLKLSPQMNTHPVVSVAQLEPMPDGTDPFHRNVNYEPGPVTEDQGDPSYEVDYITNCRAVYPRNKPATFQYRVKWKDWSTGMEWRNINQLNCPEKIKEYNDSNPPTGMESTIPTAPTPTAQRKTARQVVAVQVQLQLQQDLNLAPAETTPSPPPGVRQSRRQRAQIHSHFSGVCDLAAAKS